MNDQINLELNSGHIAVLIFWIILVILGIIFLVGGGWALIFVLLSLMCLALFGGISGMLYEIFGGY